MDEQQILDPVENTRRRILRIRGERVILDSDLALLYGATTKALNQAVKRNRSRFPEDFMFQLTWDEVKVSRSQFVTLNGNGMASRKPDSAAAKRGGNVKYRPHVFTEHGAIMAATVLNSPRAVQMSIFVVRAFVLLRKALVNQRELAEKVAELERRLTTHDLAIREMVAAIEELAALPPPEETDPPKIGFRVKESSAAYRRKRARSRGLQSRG